MLLWLSHAVADSSGASGKTEEEAQRFSLQDDRICIPGIFASDQSGMHDVYDCHTLATACQDVA